MISRQWCAISVAFLLPGMAAAAAPERCADFDPERRAYFGELHIHTGISADARLFGTTNRPADAYRFARGEEIQVRETHGEAALFPARIDRPLDFAAVTDHAENIGAISLCTTPGSEVYETEHCRFVRAPVPTDDMAVFSLNLGKIFQTMYTSEEICGEGRKRCKEAVAAPWAEIRDSADEWNAACAFTTFIGYEYSPTPDGSKLHHNVIFRNSTVMETPISWAYVPNKIEFWRQLKRGCKDAGTGCDVLSIPHNPNLGNGQMYSLAYGGESDPVKQAEIAKLRSEMGPLAEIFQQKGDSECRNGMWKVEGNDDPLCSFEKYRDWQGARFADCEEGQGSGGLQGRGCVSRLDYTRYALAAGLGEQRRIGANPHKFGVIGSVDSHDGSASDVAEWVHDGVQRPTGNMEVGRMSTGGVAGVWAEENTREAIFQAFLRRETFATSGPRMRVRLFGGFDLPEDLCGNAELAKQGYARGVPMGGELVAQEGGKAPVFVVSALSDPGSEAYSGTPLERLQIIKVWAGKGDVIHQAVIDVAGAPAGELDPTTCERKPTSGPANLCGSWRDPDYDPKVGAAYYARAIERPSCRHTGFMCARAAEGEKPALCADASIPKQIQERAWTSPIWVEPAG